MNQPQPPQQKAPSRINLNESFIESFGKGLWPVIDRNERLNEWSEQRERFGLVFQFSLVPLLQSAENAKQSRKRRRKPTRIRNSELRKSEVWNS